MKIEDQYRMIRDPGDVDSTQVPNMPILVVLQDGTVGEASTIRGAVAIVAGSKYFDCEDAMDEWNFRVEIARNQCMKAIIDDVYAVVYDKKIGFIKENYAANPDDEDYKVDEEATPIKIHVESDRNFLLSLARIKAVTIYQKQGSTLLTKWKSDIQRCQDCSYRTSKCEVYNGVVNDDDGMACNSYYSQAIKDSQDNINEYYNIAEEVDLEEVIERN